MILSAFEICIADANLQCGTGLLDLPEFARGQYRGANQQNALSTFGYPQTIARKLRFAFASNATTLDWL